MTSGAHERLVGVVALLALLRRVIQFRVGQRVVERGYDSVHLAAAEAGWTRVGGAAEFRFAVFDAGLIGAARALGIAILEP